MVHVPRRADPGELSTPTWFVLGHARPRRCSLQEETEGYLFSERLQFPIGHPSEQSPPTMGARPRQWTPRWQRQDNGRQDS